MIDSFSYRQTAPGHADKLRGIPALSFALE